MQITGKLKQKFDTIKVSDKFSKRDFVITDESSMYPQDIIFQLNQDKCSLIDLFNVGDELEVSFNLRGREWVNPQGETKYFNTLEVWKVFKNSGGVDSPKQSQPNPTPNPTDMDDDDLPF